MVSQIARDLPAIWPETPLAVIAILSALVYFVGWKTLAGPLLAIAIIFPLKFWLTARAYRLVRFTAYGQKYAYSLPSHRDGSRRCGRTDASR